MIKADRVQVSTAIELLQEVHELLSGLSESEAERYEASELWGWSLDKRQGMQDAAADLEDAAFRLGQVIESIRQYGYNGEVKKEGKTA